MVTLVSDIIRDAYREGNLVAINTEPSGAQQEEGLRLLNRVLLSVYGNEAGEELSSIPIGNNGIELPSGYPYYNEVPDNEWFIPPNARLVLNLNSPLELCLSPFPEDGVRFAIQDLSGNLDTNTLTIKGNGRRIGGETSLVFNVSGDIQEYMYRADLGTWTRVSPLETTDIWPFPTEFDDMFVISLSMRLNPRYNIAADPQSQLMLRRVTTQFKARYRQHREVCSELGLLMTSSNKDRYFDGDEADALFSSGNALPNWRRRW